jgi:hypothetical protein
VINFISSCNLCCANETGKNSPIVGATESIDKLIKTGKFKDAYDICKELILRPQEPKNLEYIAKHKIKIADTIKQSIETLNKLNRIVEVDELLEQALIVHKNDWRVLEQIAMSYSKRLPSSGVIIDNKFRRDTRQQGRFVQAFQHDHVQALMIFKQIMPLVLKDDNKNDVAQFFINWSSAIYKHSQEIPQSLTDISKLPDYSNVHFSYGDNGFAAVDFEGNPIFYGLPESFESARNDGERWRWTLDQAAKICPENFLGITLRKRAEFNAHLFGTTTLGEFNFYRSRNHGTDQTAAIWSLTSLTDDETIAKTAAGRKRFKLPDEHNYIKLSRESYNISKGGEKILAGESLAYGYINRGQFVRAAALFREIIEEFGNDKLLEGEDDDDELPAEEYWKYRLTHCREMFAQITGNWGHFTEEGSEVNGLNVNLKYTFRNGKEVKLTAHEIDVAKLVSRFKSESLGKKTRRVSFNDVLEIQDALVGDIEHRDVWGKDFVNTEQFRRQYFIGKTEWTEKLSPAKDHFNADIIIHLPVKKAGLFLIEAKMEKGNTVKAVVWLNNTAIVQKMLQDKVVYLITDSETGQPLKDMDVELLYSYMTNEKDKKSGKVIFSSMQLNAKSNADGIVNFAPSEFSRDDTSGFYVLGVSDCLVTAKSDKDKGRFAILGLDHLNIDRSDRSIYEQHIKPFVITDRPVYRPKDKVEFKVWFGNNEYDQPNKNELSGHKISYTIYDPRDTTVSKGKDIELDSYGGFTAIYELPKEAVLGTYRITFGNINGEIMHHGGLFRVEEYKKPEYEVTIDAPKEPVTLGNKFKVTVRAKYYFGSPVTEATVKYTVLRTTENANWYPVRYWDWLYGNGYSWFAYDSIWLPNWSKWSCYRPLYWSGRDYAPPEQVMINEMEIDKDGTVTFEIDSSIAKAIHPNSSHKYSITAEVVDNSRRTIVGNGAVFAAHEPFKIYAYTDRGYYSPNQKIDVNFCTKRIDGKTVSGNGEATLYKISYKKNTQNGKDNFDVVETKVHSEKVTFNDDGFAKLRLNAVSAGQYKIACTLNGQEGGYVFNVYPNTNKTQIADSGNANESWRFNALELIADKAEFAPGENLNFRINTNKEN